MGLAADGCSVSGEAIHFIPSPECRLRGLTTQRVGKENERKGRCRHRFPWPRSLLTYRSTSDFVDSHVLCDARPPASWSPRAAQAAFQNVYVHGAPISGDQCDPYLPIYLISLSSRIQVESEWPHVFDLLQSMNQQQQAYIVIRPSGWRFVAKCTLPCYTYPLNCVSDSRASRELWWYARVWRM